MAYERDDGRGAPSSSAATYGRAIRNPLKAKKTYTVVRLPAHRLACSASQKEAVLPGRMREPARVSGHHPEGGDHPQDVEVCVAPRVGRGGGLIHATTIV